MPEASHAASEHHAQDEQVCPQEYSAADPITLPEPAHQWTEERRGQPLEGKGDGDREVAPAEPLGALQVGDQHTDGKPYRRGDHAYHRGDRDDDPGVMEPRRAPGESGRVLVQHTPSESLQWQHVSPPYRRPSGERGVCHRDSRGHWSPLILHALQVFCRQQQCSSDGLPNRKRKNGSLKEPLFSYIMGPFALDESRTFVVDISLETRDIIMTHKSTIVISGAIPQPDGFTWGTSMTQPTLLGSRSFRYRLLRRSSV